LTDLVILDRARWQEPAAIINLPIRLRSGYVSLEHFANNSVHGNWVDGDVLGTKRELIDMCGVPVSPDAELPKPNAHTTSLTGIGAGGLAAARSGGMANGHTNGVNGYIGHFQGGVI